LALVHPAEAWAGPDADKLKAASDSFESGAKAFKAKQFEQAAAYFEAADDAVPSAKALRLAIRARTEAGQAARAATLAAQALDLYGADSETTKLAQETLDKLSPSLQEVKVSCVSPCLVAAGTTPIHGQQATRWRIFLEPGKTKLGATFVGNITAPEQQIFAAPGGTASLRFEPPADAKPVPPVPPTPDGPKTGDRPSNEVPPTDTPPDEAPKKKHFGAHPALFFVALGATAALGATTIWSGIDTKNNPGPDKVKAACAGKGTDCPAYKEGLAHQTRTNVLIGVTAGTAAVTLIIGAFLTNWHGNDKTDPAPSTSNASAGPRRERGPEARLWVGAPSATYGEAAGAASSGALDWGGAVVGLQGRF
jgi:hypothetical protein